MGGKERKIFCCINMDWSRRRGREVLWPMSGSPEQLIALQLFLLKERRKITFSLHFSSHLLFSLYHCSLVQHITTTGLQPYWGSTASGTQTQLYIGSQGTRAQGDCSYAEEPLLGQGRGQERREEGTQVLEKDKEIQSFTLHLRFLFSFLNFYSWLGS